ncbi:MAG: class I SAM-dependent methyltransferase [Kangiellaceae bacterium]|nr:class I SAM-dependent methyltransferase [Kangiellaceae bacterium]MCW8999016.1 class I SAM-dependent methyltransferase [Kangiellaceae bacterium]MCW9018260.1 class I SAM-dependent methyltransferase [Kangiellaceae bacterium]
MRVKSLGLLFALTVSTSVWGGSVKLEGRSEADLQRDQRSKPLEIINFAEVSKGDKILDLLGGGGYYSQLLSQAVGEKGKVVLHNNQAYMPYVDKELKSRFKLNKPQNLQRLMSEADDLKLGKGRFDKAFFIMGYHDLYLTNNEQWDVTPDKIVPQLSKALKSKGKVLVIDHQAAEGSGKSVANSLHRIEKAFVIKDMQKYGFKLISQSNLLENEKDPLNVSAFAKELKRNTSRFVLLFEKVN